MATTTPVMLIHENEEHQDNITSNPNDDDEDLYSSEEEHGYNAKVELDPAMLNELFLVCSNVGMLVNDESEGESKFLRGEDCIAWIHDLQRALRRDNARTKSVALTLGKWEILQHKLLPLWMNHHEEDPSLGIAILKILVMLTMKPPTESSQVSTQLKYLRAYKLAFLSQPIIAALVATLADPFSREGSDRTEKDYLLMELMLTLFRNCLSVPNDSAETPTLQQDFIIMLHDENLYDVLLLLAQDVESAESREWNLLLMEMFELTFRMSSPSALVEAMEFREAKENGEAVKKSNLSRMLRAEKEKASAFGSFSTRHSNFGGMLKIVRPGGKQSVTTSNISTNEECYQVPQAERKAKKKSKARKTMAGNDISDIVSNKTEQQIISMDNPRSRELQLLVLQTTESLLNTGYHQLMQSLKLEFKRGSGKLLPLDRIQYFNLVHFLSMFHRLKQHFLSKKVKKDLRSYEKKYAELVERYGLDEALKLARPDASSWTGFSAKSILQTMDMFSFNFVLQSIEEYINLKNLNALLVGVKLLTEMIACLSEMSSSADEQYKQLGQALQEKLFYEREFLERLPSLFRMWGPTVLPIEYAENLIALTHLVLKMLDQEGGSTITVLSKKRKKSKTKKKKAGESDEEGNLSEEEEEEQEVRHETSFSAKKFFTSLVNAENIKLYNYVLSKYETNDAKLNYYVHSFFFRVQTFDIKEEVIYNSEEQQQQSFTLAPMLFNMPVMLTMSTILNDKLIRAKSEYHPLILFCRNLIRHFFCTAEKNHMLFLECLLRHSYPAKTCAAIQNVYQFDNHSRKPVSSSGTNDGMTEFEREQFYDARADAKKLKRRNEEDSDLDGETEFGMTAAAVPISTNDDDKSEEEQDYTMEDDTSAPKRSQAPWSKIEDKFLTRTYGEMKGSTDSIYSAIAKKDMFSNRDRSAEDIKARVTELGLNDDDDTSAVENDENLINIEKPSSTTITQKNHSLFSDSEDESGRPELKKQKTKNGVTTLS